MISDDMRVLATISIISLIIVLVEIYLLMFDTDSKKIFELKPNTIEEANVENISTHYLDGKLWKLTPFNESCTKSPNFSDIKLTSDYWQTQNTSKGIFHIFSAYLDPRFSTKRVRIITLFDFQNVSSTFLCKFWYHNGKMRIIETEKLLLMWHKQWGGYRRGIFNPFLVTCQLPDEDIPKSVSLVEYDCEAATNNVKIIVNKRQRVKKDFVVCVKGLFLPIEDRTHRLVEWLELLDILGADKVFFYELNVGSKIKKLLQYYKDRGLVDFTPISLVGASNIASDRKHFMEQEILKTYLQEVIPYTDCLYRHFHEFKYLVLLDIDEIIIPTFRNWKQLMLKYNHLHPHLASYMASNVFFLDRQNNITFDDIPKFMHMLQHVYRARNYSAPKRNVKGFHDTEKVLTLHNHYPVHCESECDSIEFEKWDAHLQHYRRDCVGMVMNCEGLTMDSVLDTRIWLFREKLMKRVLKTLRELNDSSVMSG